MQREYLYVLRTNRQSKIRVKTISPKLHTQVLEVSETCSTRGDIQKTFEKVRLLLQPRPGYQVQAVYKLLELPITDQAQVSLVLNSYSLRAGTSTSAEVLKALRET